MKMIRVLAVALFVSAPALAQTKTSAPMSSSESDQYYKFPDDPLNAPGFGASGSTVLIPIHAQRVTLIRPRTSFVQEMFKSVLQM